jgi:surface protein
MSWMFSGCKNLYDLDLSNWDMSKANTANMFYNCPAGA